jgi:predicted metal-dependent hydrolase
MAHDLLTNPKSLEGIEEKIKALWKWHAVEEAEHKAVAFDVYKQAAAIFAVSLPR